jgi:hypothetical protein
MISLLLSILMGSSLATASVASECGRIPQVRVNTLVCVPAVANVRGVSVTMDIFERRGCRSHIRHEVIYRNSSPAIVADGRPFDGDFAGLMIGRFDDPTNTISSFVRPSFQAEEYVEAEPALFLGLKANGPLQEKRFSRTNGGIFNWNCQSLR